MYDPKDYDGEDFEREFREDAERYAAQLEEEEKKEALEREAIDERCANFVAGRCSGEAADEGGARYEMEMRAWAAMVGPACAMRRAA